MAFFGDVSKQPFVEIKNYIVRCGNAPEEWFVGIARNWVARVFSDHKVSDGEVAYVVRKCRDNAEARQVKSSLLEMGCDGGQVSGGNMSLFVYAYKKAKDTRP